jgi:hypothetical protein
MEEMHVNQVLHVTRVLEIATKTAIVNLGSFVFRELKMTLHKFLGARLVARKISLVQIIATIPNLPCLH